MADGNALVATARVRSLVAVLALTEPQPNSKLNSGALLHPL
jgi:hypothetical protein